MTLSDSPIVILGMHRSGTSCLTAALAHLGAFFGAERDFFPADESNEAGYWELAEQIGLDRRCLGSFLMAYNQSAPLPPNWREYPRSVALVEEIGAVLAKHFAGHRIWGFKEPLVSLLLPMYEAAFERLSVTPHYVVCVRNPLDVVASQRKHQPQLRDLSYSMWLDYTLSSLAGSMGRARSIVVYEELVAEPQKALERVVKRIPGWEPREDQWGEALASVQAARRHNRNDDSNLPSLASLFRDVYGLSREAASDPQGFDSGAYDERILTLRREHLRFKEMYRQPDPPRGLFTVTWTERGQKLGVRAESSGRLLWQMFEGEIGAPAGSELRLDFYQMPCLVWVRKAAWVGSHGEEHVQLEAGPGARIAQVHGSTQLMVWGPDAAKVTAPADAHSKLRVEFLVETGALISADIVKAMREMAFDASGHRRY